MRFYPGINHKRAYRIMRDAGLLLQRHTGKPGLTHEGQVVTLKSEGIVEAANE